MFGDRHFWSKPRVTIKAWKSMVVGITMVFGVGIGLRIGRLALVVKYLNEI
jgi:uncharacterized membrane protein